MNKGKTFSMKGKDVKREIYVVDVKNKILGRVAAKIAHILRGKHKPLYTPHVDVGDKVIILNAKYIKVSGKKEDEKLYFSHSGYPRGDKLLSLRVVRQRDPRRLLWFAVKGMLPKGPLGRKMIKKLTIYPEIKEVSGKVLDI
ncbi:50S ribosomal protein L13 [candidate division WOR-1 bacterium RIFOXYA2_FULL_36_21]|uniref:Large ribosomal subunit protein uL13 n=1 Tax=candidate division WOR-1 bacterium RIFOXYB2_FULL_36_35 TaxID=1802578 RepID=A0A1F4S4Z5_UNCSA|nr:MAG: 50S ribosomal protein L13 [candidate division WOR-1 bacterium RIFOXYA2_FULL_36_21]OGC15505.1 MAG: 50S ribosomal protein L13 [candidate division WOR-1 bacterium RIFOXYB2_FULL_36_35]OGC21290.1 MAG: 50S ribosomal protein L13 [candidate division WOR-1 bacterium RIFOXYA12_FULL_36_13]